MTSIFEGRMYEVMTSVLGLFSPEAPAKVAPSIRWGKSREFPSC
jgi:hypothetical protein